MKKRIKNYKSFINEELVHGFEKDLWKELDDNHLKKIFRNNSLSLREFMGSFISSQNLELIGAGISGLAFEWKPPYNLPENFYQKGFYGERFSGPSILKISPYEKEAESVKSIMEINKGKKIEGFVKYYWVKELVIPKELQLSKILMGFSKNDKKKMISDIPLFKKTIDNYREMEESTKFKKFYIICMEKVNLLSQEEKNLANFWRRINGIDKGFFDKLVKDNSESRLETIWDIIKGNKVNFLKSMFTRNEYTIIELYKKFISNSTLSKSQFMDFSKQVLNIYKNGKEMNIEIDDLHGNNLGWSGSNLVAFDFIGSE